MDFFYQLWFFRVKLDCRKLLQEESLVNLLWLYHAAQWRSPSLFFHLSAQIVCFMEKETYRNQVDNNFSNFYL